jgi:hypothetical protein
MRSTSSTTKVSPRHYSSAFGGNVSGEGNGIFDDHVDTQGNELDKSRDSEEKLPNFSIDATILPGLNCDPIAAIREIAREARLPVSIIFYVLTTRIGYNY